MVPHAGGAAAAAAGHRWLSSSSEGSCRGGERRALKRQGSRAPVSKVTTSSLVETFLRYGPISRLTRCSAILEAPSPLLTPLGPVAASHPQAPTPRLAASCAQCFVHFVFLHIESSCTQLLIVILHIVFLLSTCILLIIGCTHARTKKRASGACPLTRHGLSERQATWSILWECDMYFCMVLLHVPEAPLRGCVPP